MLLGLFAIPCPQLFGQATPVTNNTDTTIHILVEKPPVLVTPDRKYPLHELQAFINKHISWPENNLDCQGTVAISFVVEKDGSLSNTKIFKNLCPGFDEKALEIMSLMKFWEPGVLNGETVRTQLSIPIRFYVIR